jgi:hypothetical protein
MQELTVAQLIEILQGMPQDMPVEMGMNQEYQCAVSADMVVVEEGMDGRRYVCITDCPDYDQDDDYDGQPDEQQEWHDFDPDC